MTRLRSLIKVNAEAISSRAEPALFASSRVERALELLCCIELTAESVPC